MILTQRNTVRGRQHRRITGSGVGTLIAAWHHHFFDFLFVFITTTTTTWFTAIRSKEGNRIELFDSKYQVSCLNSVWLHKITSDRIELSYLEE